MREEFTSNWTEACPKDTHQLSNKYQFNIIPKELVSRLLVRLHQQMEEKAIWRYGLFLESQKVKITILSMREEFKSLPLMKLKEEFLARIKKDNQIEEEEEIKRAVSLLHSWGECIHFESSPILSEYIILDPLVNNL